jgi:hypothetical protein
LPFVVENIGGDEEDRTPGLGIANAALSQLSYIPANDSLEFLVSGFKFPDSELTEFVTQKP